MQDCLSRLPARQNLDRICGLSLWLPRLGVTVLSHEPVTSGWVCTLIAADTGPSGRLPTGAFEVSDLELRTAIHTRNPWLPTADLTAPEFGDAWQIQLACHGGSLRVGVALLSGMDPDTLTVDAANPTIRARSGCRHPAGFAQACRRLREAGLLHALFDDTTTAAAGVVGPRRYGLALPPVPAAEWMSR